MFTRAPMFCLVVMICGCVQLPLKRNFIKQSTTIAEIEYQQVIDNLAKFSANPDTLPHFSLPGSGTTQIGGSANGGMLFNFSPFGLINWNFNFGGSGSEQANWVLAPVNDPNRLKRIRCAFQIAVGAMPLSAEAGPEVDCYECRKMFIAMGLVKTDGTAVDQETRISQSSEEIPGLPKMGDGAPSQCLATSSCHFPTGWFCVGGRNDVPPNACYVGSHCGTYAWVTPRGMDEFSRFTLTILTLATTDPPGPNAEVERTLDPNGNVTSIKVKTRENVTVDTIQVHKETATDEEQAGQQKSVERVNRSGPISEPRTSVPFDALPGIIQLQAPPP